MKLRIMFCNTFVAHHKKAGGGRMDRLLAILHSPAFGVYILLCIFLSPAFERTHAYIGVETGAPNRWDRSKR